MKTEFALSMVLFTVQKVLRVVAAFSVVPIIQIVAVSHSIWSFVDEFDRDKAKEAAGRLRNDPWLPDQGIVD